jgi:hypothetical protein
MFVKNCVVKFVLGKEAWSYDYSTQKHTFKFHLHVQFCALKSTQL